MNQEKNREQREDLEEYAGLQFKGLAADVIGEVKHQRDTWRRVALVLAFAVVIEAAALVTAALK